MSQNKKAVEKRKAEIQEEELDSKAEYIYMQKNLDGSSLLETKYLSGRIVRERKEKNG